MNEKQAFEAASFALYELERERNEKWRDAQRKAGDAVMNEYAPRVSELTKAKIAAQRALDAANIEAGKSALEGLFRGVLVEWGYPKRRWGGARVGNQKIALQRATLEVRTPQSQMPGNVSDWRLPKMGSVFLRILKKDGTPGMKVESYNAERDAKRWLPEGQTPEPKIEAA